MILLVGGTATAFIVKMWGVDLRGQVFVGCAGRMTLIEIAFISAEMMREGKTPSLLAPRERLILASKYV